MPIALRFLCVFATIIALLGVFKHNSFGEESLTKLKEKKIYNEFTVNPQAVKKIDLSAICSGPFVAYLNGIEVARSNKITNAYTGITPSYQNDPAWTRNWISTFPSGCGYNSTPAWNDFNYVLECATDSAAAATALFTGIKTQNGRINVSLDLDSRFVNIGEIAKTLGKAVGAVSSVPVSHATPGAWTSHNNNRRNGYAISDEAFFEHPNTTGLPSETGYAGGHGANNPSVDVLIGDRRAGYVNPGIRDKLAAESGQPGKHILVERSQGQDGGAVLSALANDPGTTKLAGLFDHIYHTADDSGFDPENPTLADSSVAALKVLNRNRNGFVLLVEGGAVDWASHANNMDHMIGELIDFNEAVQAVADWVEDATNGSSWRNTLLVVTGDHETGYLTAGPNTFPDKPLGEISDRTLALEKIISGSGGRRASWQDDDGDDEIDAGETVYWAWNTGSHSNSLIPLFARGPGADPFAGFTAGTDDRRGDYLDNTDVFAVMDIALKDQQVFPTAIFLLLLDPN